MNEDDRQPYLDDYYAPAARPSDTKWPGGYPHEHKLYGPLTADQSRSASFWRADWEKKFGPKSTVGDIGEYVVRMTAVMPPLTEEQKSELALLLKND